MTTKTKSRILEAVHESASDLRRLGLIDKRKMQKYDALCLEPVQDYDAVKVKALRARLHLSQAVLASVLNTSTSPVRTWEVGDKRRRSCWTFLSTRGCKRFFDPPIASHARCIAIQAT